MLRGPLMRDVDEGVEVLMKGVDEDVDGCGGEGVDDGVGPVSQ